MPITTTTWEELEATIKRLEKTDDIVQVITDGPYGSIKVLSKKKGRPKVETR